MAKEVIITALQKLAAELGIESEVKIERPGLETHGDWASPLPLEAFALLRDKYQSPRKLAEVLVERLCDNVELSEMVDIEVAGPGFINFKYKYDWLAKQIDVLVKMGDGFGRGEWGNGKRVLVEYSSPNIAKKFSVGHLRSTIIGQAIYNLYKFGGWNVVGDNHLGDWGTQFGVIIAAVEEQELDVGQLTVGDLEAMYVDFNKRAEVEPRLMDLARDAFARLERGETKARTIWQTAKDVSLREFSRIYEQLDVQIDHAYGEADYEELMQREVISEVKEKLAVKSQGAWIVEFDNLPPAMLVKTNGTTTYFTRDLATVKFRQSREELKSDLYIYEVGAEQELHFRQVFSAAEKMGWGKMNQFRHVGHGMMSLPEGKMSTRKGRTVKLEQLLDEAQNREMELLVGRGFDEEKLREISRKLGIDAVKFNELRHNPQTNYVFIWDEALRLDGDSGPYVQYAMVRAKKILSQERANGNPVVVDRLWNETEMRLLRWILRFPEVTRDAAVECTPNILCEYLIELASRFNLFYTNARILQAEDEDKQVRLKLTSITATVLESGLKLLGMSTPELM